MKRSKEKQNDFYGQILQYKFNAELAIRSGMFVEASGYYLKEKNLLNEKIQSFKKQSPAEKGNSIARSGTPQQEYNKYFIELSHARVMYVSALLACGNQEFNFIEDAKLSLTEIYMFVDKKSSFAYSEKQAKELKSISSAAEYNYLEALNLCLINNHEEVPEFLSEITSLCLIYDDHLLYSEIMFAVLKMISAWLEENTEHYNKNIANICDAVTKTSHGLIHLLQFDISENNESISVYKNSYSEAVYYLYKNYKTLLKVIKATYRDFPDKTKPVIPGIISLILNPQCDFSYLSDDCKAHVNSVRGEVESFAEYFHSNVNDVNSECSELKLIEESNEASNKYKYSQGKKNANFKQRLKEIKSSPYEIIPTFPEQFLKDKSSDIKRLMNDVDELMINVVTFPGKLSRSENPNVTQEIITLNNKVVTDLNLLRKEYPQLTNLNIIDELMDYLSITINKADIVTKKYLEKQQKACDEFLLELNQASGKGKRKNKGKGKSKSKVALIWQAQNSSQTSTVNCPKSYRELYELGDKYYKDERFSDAKEMFQKSNEKCSTLLYGDKKTNLNLVMPYWINSGIKLANCLQGIANKCVLNGRVREGVDHLVYARDYLVHMHEELTKHSAFYFQEVTNFVQFKNEISKSILDISISIVRNKSTDDALIGMSKLEELAKSGYNSPSLPGCIKHSNSLVNIYTLKASFLQVKGSRCLTREYANIFDANKIFKEALDICNQALDIIFNDEESLENNKEALTKIVTWISEEVEINLEKLAKEVARRIDMVNNYNDLRQNPAWKNNPRGFYNPSIKSIQALKYKQHFSSLVESKDVTKEQLIQAKTLYDKASKNLECSNFTFTSNRLQPVFMN